MIGISNVIHNIIELQIDFKSLLNWRIVRIIAELRILTKASYFMLIFVPILGGLWPVVRLYVNNHNDAVIQATKVLKKYSQEFNNSRVSLENTLTKEIEGTITTPRRKPTEDVIKSIKLNSDEFSDDVKKFTNDFIPRTLDEPLLPWTWAAAFFASLFAVIAHLIYQLTAPEILRKFTLDEFEKWRKEDYSKHPSEDALKRAENYLSTKEGHRESKIDESRARRLFEKLYSNLLKRKQISAEEIASDFSLSELSTLKSYLPQNQGLPSAKEMLEIVQKAYIENSVKTGIPVIEKQRSMTVIERGARAEYMYWAARKLPMAFLAIAIYIGSIFIIIEIVCTQSFKVMEISGWSSIYNLFKFERRTGSGL